MEPIFSFLMGAAMFFTLLVLVIGIVSFGVYGDFYRRNSNKLMRLRVIFQGLALLFFGLLFYTVIA